MSTYLNCILQKKNKETLEWETVLTNVFNGCCRELHEFLSGHWGQYDGIAHEGLPKGLEGDLETPDGEPTYEKDGSYRSIYLNGYHLGDWGFGWCTLKEFCDADTYPDPEISDRFEIEKHPNGYTVTFRDLSEEDPHYFIKAYQLGLKAFFDTYSEGTEYGEEYRLVFGYS